MSRQTTWSTSPDGRIIQHLTLRKCISRSSSTVLSSQLLATLLPSAFAITAAVMSASFCDFDSCSVEGYASNGQTWGEERVPDGGACMALHHTHEANA